MLVTNYCQNNFEYAYPSFTNEELHVIGTYGRTGPAEVTVDRPGKDVTLIVSGYETIVWNIIATPGTNIVRIINMCGYSAPCPISGGFPVINEPYQCGYSFPPSSIGCDVW